MKLRLFNNGKPLDYYSSTVHVKGYDQGSYICFAYYKDIANPDFGLKITMYETNADAWLKMLKRAGVPLKSWYFKTVKSGTYVWITFKGYITNAAMIFYGNLCKGVSEFSWLAERIQIDEVDEPFFSKSRRIFLENIANFGYNDNHGWEPNAYGFLYKKETPPLPNVLTIEEAIAKFKVLKPDVGNVWSTILYGKLPT